MQDPAYLTHLKRAGLALVVVGAVDIAAMVYCILRGISYSSSFHIFAVVAGVFLLKGNLRAASAVRWFAVFMLAALCATVLAWPFMQPLDLTLTQARLAPGQAVFTLGLLAFVVALLLWLYRELGTTEVLAARAAAGRKVRDLRIPAALGLGLVVIMTATVPLFLEGESGSKAKAIAQQQLGGGYQYHVSSLRVAKTLQGTFVAGVVTAWNDHEVKTVPVEWRE
jgi:hypothetical protein